MSAPYVIQYPWNLTDSVKTKQSYSAQYLSSFKRGMGACYVSKEESLWLEARVPCHIAYINNEKHYVYEIPDAVNYQAAALSIYFDQDLFQTGETLEIDDTSGRQKQLRYILLEIEKIKIAGQAASANRYLDSQKNHCTWPALSVKREEIRNSHTPLKSILEVLAERHMLVKALSDIAQQPNLRLVDKGESIHFSKVKKMNKSQIIELAKRPGQSIIEKTYPSGKINALVKAPNYDLLENRVAIDLCTRYLEIYRVASDLVKDIKSVSIMASLCRDLLNSTYFQSVRKLEGICISPNLVLRKNTLYSQIWLGYDKLIRVLQETASYHQWFRNSFATSIQTQLGQAFVEANFGSEITSAVYGRTFKINEYASFGSWINSSTMPGPRTFEGNNNSQTVVCILGKKDIPALIDGIEENSNRYSREIASYLGLFSQDCQSLKLLTEFNADFYLLKVNREKRQKASSIQIWPIYVLAGFFQGQSEALFKDYGLETYSSSAIKSLESLCHSMSDKLDKSSQEVSDLSIIERPIVIGLKTNQTLFSVQGLTAKIIFFELKEDMLDVEVLRKCMEDEVNE